MQRKITKPVVFIIITFFLSYLLAAVFYSAGGKWNTPAAMAVGVAYMFMPAFSVVIVQKLIYREQVINPLGISFKLSRWYLAAWLLPPVVAFLAFGVGLLFPGVHYDPEMTALLARFEGVVPPEKILQMKEQAALLPIHPIWLGLLQGLIAGPTINAVAGFGEELGWRGFLLREFAHHGFWKSSGMIGLIWGIWHAPLVLQGHNYPQHPVAGVFMMTAWCVLLSPIFSFITLRARSVIAAAVLHGTLNSTCGLAIMTLSGGNDLLTGVTGLAGFIVLILVNIIIYLSLKRENLKTRLSEGGHHSFFRDRKP